MRKLFLLAVLLLYGGPARGREVQVQAFWTCDRQQLMQGDSCTVTLVLFSPYVFDEVRIKGMPRITGGKIRRLPVTPYVDRVRTFSRDDNPATVLNRLVYASFRAKAEGVGKLRVKPLKIHVTLKKYESLRGTFGKARGKNIKRRVCVRKWELPIIPKPRKSTTELMRSRGFL